jgi:hypothetical protein
VGIRGESVLGVVRINGRGVWRLPLFGLAVFSSKMPFGISHLGMCGGEYSREGEEKRGREGVGEEVRDVGEEHVRELGESRRCE